MICPIVYPYILLCKGQEWTNINRLTSGRTTLNELGFNLILVYTWTNYYSESMIIIKWIILRFWVFVFVMWLVQSKFALFDHTKLSYELVAATRSASPFYDRPCWHLTIYYYPNVPQSGNISLFCRSNPLNVINLLDLVRESDVWKHFENVIWINFSFIVI